LQTVSNRSVLYDDDGAVRMQRYCTIWFFIGQYIHGTPKEL
jgi:hypothetical protein